MKETKPKLREKSTKRKAKESNVCYIWVYERQTKGALHGHFAIHVPKEYLAKFHSEKVHRQVRKILLKICKLSGIDLFAKEEGGTWLNDLTKPIIKVELCKWSVAAYFSKEATKDPLELPDGTLSSPVKWAETSRALQRQVNSKRFSAKFFVKSEEDALKMIRKLKTVISADPKSFNQKTQTPAYWCSVKNPTNNKIHGYQTRLSWGACGHFREVLRQETEMIKEQLAVKFSLTSLNLTLYVNGDCFLKFSTRREKLRHPKIYREKGGKIQREIMEDKQI